MDTPQQRLAAAWSRMQQGQHPAFATPTGEDMDICVGCGVPCVPAVYAVMHQRDFEAISAAPTILGTADYHAAPVCQTCYTKPTTRQRTLKAHFAMPADVHRMVGAAGSSTGIG